MALLGANADLWTADGGYNQDLAIFVSNNGQSAQLVGWKESGGYAGTFSPNAAFVQATWPVLGGHTYAFTLGWKTNVSGLGKTIFVGAGPVAGGYSPTRITAQIVLAPTVTSAVSISHYQQSSSDASSWTPLDPAHLSVTVQPSTDSMALLGANADLWTANAGYNQDLAILVSDGGGAAQLVGWKESGGFAGIYSPNAAFVQETWPLLAGHTYTFTLGWKANMPALGKTICVGAGPDANGYSPTRLAAQVL